MFIIGFSNNDKSEIYGYLVLAFYEGRYNGPQKFYFVFDGNRVVNWVVKVKLIVGYGLDLGKMHEAILCILSDWRSHDNDLSWITSI